LINPSFVAEIPMCIASIPIFNAEIFAFLPVGLLFLYSKSYCFGGEIRSTWWFQSPFQNMLVKICDHRSSMVEK
jgi:hypothetical protein